MASNLKVLQYYSDMYGTRQILCGMKDGSSNNCLIENNKENNLPGFLQCMIQWDSSSVHFEHLTLPPGCWRYRGEGNANIVIALKDEAAIIRLSKNYSGVSWNDHHKKKVERQVVFTTHVFAPLLGNSFVANVRAVFISPEQINQLNDCLQRIRPHHRMHKELKVPYATAHSDFARTLKFSSQDVDYCVEIKPKKGWWGKSSTIEVRPNLCTYCLNQYQKLKKSKITSRSNYCPLDLFSGVPARTVQAVISLLANPQNNLRIFRDGRLVYSDTSKSNLSNSLQTVINEWMSSSGHQLPGSASEIGPLRNFVYLICLALLKPHSDCTDGDRGMKRYFQLKNELQELIINHSMVEQDRGDFILNDKIGQPASRKCCIRDSCELPVGSVLSRILSAQKLEDSDGKYVRKLFKKICPVHAETKSAKLIEGFSSPPSYDECPSSKCVSSESWLDEMGLENLTQKELMCIQRHLLAATVKDCSIMMTFSPISSIRHDWSAEETGDTVLQDLHGSFHRSRVGIVDLDPKPISAIVKHHLREGEMVKAYYSADD